MKKSSLALLFITLITTFAYSDGVLFGLKGGVDFSSYNETGFANAMNRYYESEFSTDCSTENTFDYSGHGGLFLTIPMGRIFAIQSEALYRVMKTKLRTDINDSWESTITYSDIFKVFEIPLVMKIRLSKSFSIYGGGFYQLLIGAEYDYGGDFYGGDDIDSNYLNDHSYGISLGMDYFFPLKKNALIVDLRYNMQRASLISDIASEQPTISYLDMSLGIVF